FKKTYTINKGVELPFLNLKVQLQPDAINYENSEYFIRFDDFNQTVANYKAIDVSADVKALSVVRLQLEGSNKNRLVEYLNVTVDMLRKNELDRKNLFAINTISFIDSTLVQMEDQIKDAEGELKEFRKGKNIYELEEGGGGILTEKLSG